MFKIILFLSFFFSFASWGTAGFDHNYSLEKIGYLKAWDNVDGVFGPYVETAFENYFERQSRFVVQDLSEADEVFDETDMPYKSIIEDREILAQLARSTESKSIIRTKVTKEGTFFNFAIDWLHAPNMDVISKTSFKLDQPTGGQGLASGEINDAMSNALDRLIAGVPFVGQVTGRDDQEVTVDIGANADVREGDVLTIETLEEVKVHPLLNTVVDWQFNEVGSIEIVEVEPMIAFGKILEEHSGRSIGKFQKVTKILRKKVSQLEDRKFEDEFEKPPRLGSVRASGIMGMFSRELIIPGGETNQPGKDGSGLSFGPKIIGELWFSNKFYSEFDFQFGVFSYNQNPVNHVAEKDSSGSVIYEVESEGNFFDFKFIAGYSFLVGRPSGDETVGLHNTSKASVRAGFHYQTVDLQLSETYSMGPNIAYGPSLGLGGVLPIRSGFGVEMAFDLGFLHGFEETGAVSVIPAATDSVLDFSVHFGFSYHLLPRVQVALIGDVKSQSTTFKVSGYNLKHTAVNFGPQIAFFF